MLVTNKIKMTWPHSVISQFEAVDPNTMVESEWYAPYNMLLQHVFKYEDGFGVAPLYSPYKSPEAIDFTTSILWKGFNTWFLSLRSSHIPILSISPDTAA